MSGFTVDSDNMATEVVDSSVSPAIRKSCHFCRSRKIRCSGQRMCAACRARNLDCVYGREASKGRPRGSTSTSIASKSASQKDRDTKSSSRRHAEYPNHSNDGSMSAAFDVSLCQEPSADSAGNFIIGNIPRTSGSSGSQNGLIASELEQTFHRIFIDHPPQVSTYGSILFPPEPERSTWDVLTDSSTSSNSPGSSIASTAPPVAYERLFFGLIPGLVELVTARFGSLGFCQRDDTLTQYFAMSLAQDRNMIMFDTDEAVEMPPKYSDHQVCQMIELWFFHHPLSFIVSKTLLLHSYRSGNHDESLLAAILAGASFALNDAGSRPAHKLYQWAQSRLCSQNARALSLPAIQSLILLGWHELCLSQARRGYCYLEMARLAIIDFHTRLKVAPGTEIDWINGVDIGKVELELCQRMYWLTFALELWAALQKDIPFLDPLPADVEVKFPPLDEASSAVLILDKESGNVATLGAQQRAMRELWPLSHIASTIESIYALYPRHAVSTAAFQSSGWVSQTLPRLRHLLVESPLSDVCQRIRDILADGLDKFQSQMGNHPSEIFTLSVYRTLIIQLLFPRQNMGESAPRMTEASFSDTIRFVTAFKDTLQGLNQPTVGQHNVLVGASDSTNAQMAVLGLDSCGRALHQLFSLAMAGSSLDQDRLTLRQAGLAQLAGDLHELSRHPRLRSVPVLPMVKKSLKRARQCFEGRAPALVPQACRSHPWSGSLPPTVGMPPTLDPQMIGSSLRAGNAGYSLPSDLIFDGNMASWNEHEWDGIQDQAMLSGISLS